MSFWKRVWQRWKVIAEVIAAFQSRVVLSIFYFVVVLPFGVAVRLFADPLGIRGRRQTAWTDLADREQTLDEARRQF